MRVAVILCTYNRCQSLVQALESLAVSRMPESVEWRVLVVDNNSSDQTRAVAEEFAARYPGRFEYLFEPCQGKSRALNFGIKHAANADILAFVDDDVRVDPYWLHKLTSPMEDPQWSGSGGRIMPGADFKPPAWLETGARYALAPLAMFDPAIPAGELHEPPFGTNMAFRSQMFSKYGTFRLDLGPQPGGEIKNEDVELGSRLLSQGERLWYEPAAIVYHPVVSQRLRKEYFLMWWYGKGRSEIRQAGPNSDHQLSLSGVPLVLLRRLAVWTVRWLITFNAGRRFSCKVKVWWLSGEIRESFVQSRMTAQLRLSRQQSTP